MRITARNHSRIILCRKRENSTINASTEEPESNGENTNLKKAVGEKRETKAKPVKESLKEQEYTQAAKESINKKSANLRKGNNSSYINSTKSEEIIYESGNRKAKSIVEFLVIAIATLTSVAAIHKKSLA